MLRTKIQESNRTYKIKFKLFFESARLFYFCAMIQQVDDSILQALDHFISEVFPNLFKGRSTTDPNYKRVYALVSERKKSKAGKPNRLNDDWIIKTLTEFGGEVDGQPRYNFNRVTTVTIAIESI